MAIEQSVRVELFETIPIIPLGTYAPGVIEKQLFAQGNSLLSSLFVKTIGGGGTLSVEYHESTTGDDEGEDTLLDQHVTPTPGQTNKIIVSRIHNKPRIKAIITGAPIRFGVYVSVISSFASDLDNALVLNGATADLASALGLQTAIYDPVAGKFFFAKGTAGIQDVNVVGFDESGSPFSVLSAPGLVTDRTLQDVIVATVPGGKKWKLRQVITVSRCYGEFDILVDGSSVGGGVTSPVESNARFTFTPYALALAGKEVKVTFIENYGPLTNLKAFLQITEEDA